MGQTTQALRSVSLLLLFAFTPSPLLFLAFPFFSQLFLSCLLLAHSLPPLLLFSQSSLALHSSFTFLQLFPLPLLPFPEDLLASFFLYGS